MSAALSNQHFIQPSLAAEGDPLNKGPQIQGWEMTWTKNDEGSLETCMEQIGESFDCWHKSSDSDEGSRSPPTPSSGHDSLAGGTSQMPSHDHEKNFYGEPQASLILEGLDFDSGRTSDRCGSVKNHNFEDEPPPPKRMSRCSVRGNESNLTPPGHFSFSNTSRSRFVGSAFWGLIGTKVGPPNS